MNKYIFSALLLLLLFILLTSVSLAVTNISPAPKEEKEEIGKQINDLTERIASRVAQLKLVEKRGLVGKVIDVSNTQITISDIHSNTRFVDVDELTKFSSPNAKASFGISDIEKGSTVGIMGLYNKESRRIMARFVTVLNLPRYIHGTVSSINRDNFQVTIKTKENNKFDIDVETTTIISSPTNSLKLVKSGFSKLTNGDYLIVVGFEDKKKKDLIIASKIIVFSDLNKENDNSAPTPTLK